MKQIDDVKGILKNKDLLSLLAESVYNPTEDRLNNLADTYINNPNTVIYAIYEDDLYLGIIILEIKGDKIIEILNIAVNAGFRKSGIGSSLINHCIDTFHPRKILAETDDEAARFYRKLGFEIKSLGDKYRSGIMRYQCTFKG